MKKETGMVTINERYELPTEYCRWHHLAAYDKYGELIEISDWIDPVHGHGLPFLNVYVKPMKQFVLFNQKLPYSYVQVGPTNSCNLACEGCYSSACRNGATLEFEQIQEVIKKVKEQVDQCGSETAMISFHGPGEPLASKKNRDVVLRCIQLCNEYGLASRITTNASFDDNEFIKELIANPSLKLLWVSMKAGNRDAYLKYTGKDLFDKVHDNMRLISEWRKKYKRNDLVLKASTEISKFSIYSTFDAARYAKNIGFDVFKPALHSVDFKGVYENNKEEILNLRRDLKNIYDEKFNSLYWEIPKRYSDNYYADKFPSCFCFQVETRLYFDGHGEISPCISWLDEHTDEYDFGNIKNLVCFDQKEGISSFNRNNESTKLNHCSKCSDPWVNYFHQWIYKILQKEPDATIVKVFDDEISDKFPQLANENVLDGYDPRENYYD